MSLQRYLWRVYCLGASHYATSISATAPTVCPVDGDPIDATQTVIVEARYEEIFTDGYISLNSGLADSQAIIVNAANTNGGIDIDAGFGGIAVDTTNAISLDAAAASNFTTSLGNLTLESTNGLVEIHAPNTSTGGINIGATTSPVVIVGNTNGATSLTLRSGTGGTTNYTTGTWEVSASGQVSLTSTAASASAIEVDASGSSSGVQILTGSGGFLLNSGTGKSQLASVNTSVDAIRLDTSASSGGVFLAAGSSGISIGNDGVAHPVTIGNLVGATGVAVYAGTGNVDITSTAASTITANTSVNVGNTSGTVVNIGNSSAGTAVNIDSGWGAINIGLNSGNQVRIGATGGSNQVYIRRGSGGFMATQPAHTSKSASSTLTAAEVLTSIIVVTTGLTTMTLPTAANMVAGIQLAIVDDSVDIVFINTAALTAVTVAVNTGGTLIGSATVLASSSGTYRLRLTNVTSSSEAYTLYRLA